MPMIFTVLGAIVTSIGALWIALVLRNLPAAEAAVLAGWLAAAPGFSVVMSGLLLLAIGQVLHRLAQIARNTGDTADALEALVKRGE